MRRHRVELLRGVVAISAMLAICGCTSHSYAEIDLRPGRAPTDLQALAEQARAGDKQAQLELGVRYEEGRGVRGDHAAARRLYAAAATSTGGIQMMYIPAAGNVRASVVPVSAGPRRDGLAEARARLVLLDGYQELAPPERRRKLKGTIRYIGPSDVCETESAAIRKSTMLAVGECRATGYRLTDKQGRVTNLVDLILVSNDADAVADMHIPFGLIDTGENDLFSQNGDPIRGTVTFAVVAASRGDLNIIRSFKRGR